MKDFMTHNLQMIAHSDDLLTLSCDLDNLDMEIINRRDKGEYEGLFALQLDRAIMMIKLKSIENQININQDERII